MFWFILAYLGWFCACFPAESLVRAGYRGVSYAVARTDVELPIRAFIVRAAGNAGGGGEGGRGEGVIKRAVIEY